MLVILKGGDEFHGCTVIVSRSQQPSTEFVMCFFPLEGDVETPLLSDCQHFRSHLRSVERCVLPGFAPTENRPDGHGDRHRRISGGVFTFDGYIAQRPVPWPGRGIADVYMEQQSQKPGTDSAFYDGTSTPIDNPPSSGN